jgi:hypothetical protein
MLILQGKIMRYAPSRFLLLPHLLSEHKRNIQRGWNGNISLKKFLLLEEKGKEKGSPSMTEKL